MAWEIIKALVTPKTKEPPDFNQQKLIWNDAAKIETKVKELVADELSVDINRVVSEADWYKDFGCSLDVVEVFMRCEEEFGIDIPDEVASECETVGKLTAHIQRTFGVEPK
jgi:acyl carrier protein